MASKRSIPTDLFWDEAFSEMSGETQSIFLGLVLGADDHGRGVASVKSLGRMLAKDPALIHAALAILQESEFVQCYQVEGKDYYHIRRWEEWETLNKPARSRYPAPPQTRSTKASPAFSEKAPQIPGKSETFSEKASENPRKSGVFSEKVLESPGKSGAFWENAGEAQKIRPEEEGKGREGEEEGEDCHTESKPANVLTFPTRDDDEIREKAVQTEPAAVTEAQVAGILRLPVTDALKRLVVEYASLPGLSLLGEADAAREWIQDAGRNKGRKSLTVAFFRSWLKRESEAIEQRRVRLRQAATGTTGASGSQQERRRLPSLMHLAEEDRVAKGGKG
jgi:hypothetical protein